MEEDPPPGVPEWVVTYGDMMSLLLTFFIMLVSMAEMAADDRYRAILDSFQQRLGYRMAPQMPPGENFPLNAVMQRVELLMLGSFSDSDNGNRGTRKPSPPGDENKVFTGPEGTGTRVGQPIVADETGQITSIDEARILMMGQELRGKPNKIEVRGWIDAETVEDETRRSTLENAYRRGDAVRELLVSAGIEPDRVRVAVVPAPDGSPIVTAELRRQGAVTVSVLDAYESDFVGSPDR